VDGGKVGEDGGEDEVQKQPEPKKGAAQGVQATGHTGGTYRPEQNEAIVHCSRHRDSGELANMTSK
jgi:hypothetical protein